MYNIVGKNKILLSISAVLVGASILALTLWGLKPGIDFTGGTIMEINYTNERPTATTINEELKGLNLGQIDIRYSGDNGVILRFTETNEQVHQEILQKLGQPEETRYESIGPTIGKELTGKATWAVVLVLAAILLYLVWAFRRLSRVVKKGESWRYGAGAMLALFHDVIVMLGLFAVLGHFRGTEINSTFIVAILTVLGYSVNDTIVIYDRVRENLLVDGWRDFRNTVNRSLNETIVRSLGTTVTVIVAILAVYLFGGESTRDFILAMIAGVATGAWSTIAIACPFLLLKRK
ncbi:MAG: protein translocase subunit SecF [Patescibacteria group bacterium]|nr:protein translocase subunit SecF [Patescibacteria group bacterium]MDD5121229.1 protein translocase subunit SecF [Patescibacteria group bacterium]MDD5222250.1 protein translocase subunit SecF [Patescibacteria group bacterium]MDD5395852.1 protein translocase subunit SecF [Patescibacteria group bacterium]